MTTKTPSPRANMPTTPKKIPFPTLYDTTDLSPSKYNELNGDNPARTSPSPKSKSPHRRNPQQRAHGMLSENVRPTFSQPVKYPSLPPSAEQLEYDYVHNISPRSATALKTPRSYQHRLDYTKSPIDPFKDSPNVSSNVGRRRANAISLINSPARRSHSQEMALMYEQAREVVQLQNLTKGQLRQPRSLLTTSTSKRQTPKRHWSPDKEFRSESRIPVRSGENIAPHRPLPKPIQPYSPYLPEWQPMRRLSDEMSRELMDPFAFPQPLRPRERPSSCTACPRIISQVPSPIIRSPRRRPLFNSVDSGVGMPPNLKREDAFSGTGASNDGFEATSMILTPLECTQPFQSPVVARVTSWLETVDPASAQDENVEETCSGDGDVVEELTIAPPTDSHLSDLGTPPRASDDEEDSQGQSSTIRKLICVPTPRPRLPSWQRTGVESLATPPRRFKIPARQGSGTPLSAPLLRFGHQPNTSKTRSSDPEQLDSKTAGEVGNGDHVDDVMVDELKSMDLADLSPDVQVHRRGGRGKRMRCLSYFDEDILTLEKQKGEGSGDT